MRRSKVVCSSMVLACILAACGGGGGKTSGDGLPPTRGTQSARQIRVPATSADAQKRHSLATNILSDPGFESGGFSSWSQCGNVNAAMSTTRAHTGTYSARAGSAGSTSGEINGDAGVCQQVTIPAGGTLSFWYYGFSSETSTTYAYQEAELMNSAGTTVRMLWQAVDESTGWTQKTFDVSAYAGQTLWLYFGVHGDGY